MASVGPQRHRGKKWSSELTSTDRRSSKEGHTLQLTVVLVQGSSNMTGTDMYVNKLHCAAAVRP